MSWLWNFSKVLSDDSVSCWCCDTWVSALLSKSVSRPPFLVMSPVTTDVVEPGPLGVLTALLITVLPPVLSLFLLGGVIGFSLVLHPEHSQTKPVGRPSSFSIRAAIYSYTCVACVKVK